jgi:flagellar FliL protein
MAAENEQQSGKKGSPLLTLIVIFFMVIILGAGGFVGWNMFVKGEAGENGDGKAVSRSRTTKMNKQPKIIHPLEAFIVNLMDKKGLGKRYLKVTIELELAGEEEKTIVEQFKPQLKDTVLLLLSNQTFTDISTMEGKLELKQSLLYRINQLLGDQIVDRIYFTEFVVQ